MHSASYPPVFLPPGAPLGFPDPRLADAEGLIAVGGDLLPERLLHAYAHGIFPWHDDDVPPLWWSPDPRAIFEPETLHVSRRLARRMRASSWHLTWDAAFDDVVHACATERREGTWIVASMRAAYGRLHRLGHAHSLEVWDGADLVGGLYGVHVGGLFAGESMFHRVTDASKVALVACVRGVFARGIRLFDVQMMNPHLARMGARPIARDAYLGRLAEVAALPVDLSDLAPPRESTLPGCEP